MPINHKRRPHHLVLSLTGRDGGRPGQPIADRGVGVVEPKVVLCPRQASAEFDDVTDGLGSEGGVGLGETHLGLVI